MRDKKRPNERILHMTDLATGASDPQAPDRQAYSLSNFTAQQDKLWQTVRL